MQFSPGTAEMLETLMRWRRDVRHFRTDPVPAPVLARLQQAMELAPSVGNSRPWRVLLVESPALRAAVRAEFVRCNAQAAGIYEGEQAAAYARLKLAGLDNAPVQLAVFTDLTPQAGHGLGRQTMPETLEQSTAMAIHTLWLTARAENSRHGHGLYPGARRHGGAVRGGALLALLRLSLPRLAGIHR